MKRIIQHDQGTSIPGIHELLNSYKSVNVIHHVDSTKYKNYIITSVIEKAFDKMQYHLWFKKYQKK